MLTKNETGGGPSPRKTETQGRWLWRLVSWFGDASVVAAALWCAYGDAPQTVVNISNWIAATVALAGLLNTLVGDDESKDPVWWDASIRAIPTIAFASVGWWWMCAAWSLNWVGHFVKRE